MPFETYISSLLTPPLNPPQGSVSLGKLKNFTTQCINCIIKANMTPIRRVALNTAIKLVLGLVVGGVVGAVAGAVVGAGFTALTGEGILLGAAAIASVGFIAGAVSGLITAALKGIGLGTAKGMIPGGLTGLIIGGFFSDWRGVLILGFVGALVGRLVRNIFLGGKKKRPPNKISRGAPNKKGGSNV